MHSSHHNLPLTQVLHLFISLRHAHNQTKWKTDKQAYAQLSHFVHGAHMAVATETHA